MEYKDFEFHLKSSLQGEEIQLTDRQLAALLPASKTDYTWKWIILISGIIALATALFWLANKDNNTKSTASYINKSASTVHNTHSNNNDANIKTKVDSKVVMSNNDNVFENTLENTDTNATTSSISNLSKTSIKSITPEHNETLTSAIEIDKHLSSIPNISSSINNTTVKLDAFTGSTASEKMGALQQDLVLPVSQLTTLEGLDMKKVNSGQKMFQFTKKVQCADFFVGRKVAFAIIPEIGIFYPFKSLENNASEPTLILPLREENETSLEGLFAALYGRMTFRRSGFYIQAGVSYARHVEKMSLSYDFIEKDTTRGIISTTISTNGDTITNIYGDIIKETHLSGNKIVHHSFSLIDIPIVVGYEKPFGDWIIGADLGVNVNVNMKANGKILSSATDFQPTDTNPYNFNKNVGLQLRGTLHAGRNISEKSRVYLGIRGTYLPNTYSDDSNPITQSYRFGGAYLGLIYRL
ncbi:MAG: hypothetical protein R2774_06605 [Saprospiraceae bacterium]